jgi:CheY-like chemotaxis protein
MRILAVDDDTMLLTAVRNMLRRNGHCADCCDNAETAVAMAKSHTYDVVLIDYRMPEHDGLWFLRNASLPPSAKVICYFPRLQRSAVGLSTVLMVPEEWQECGKAPLCRSAVPDVISMPIELGPVVFGLVGEGLVHTLRGCRCSSRPKRR